MSGGHSFIFHSYDPVFTGLAVAKSRYTLFCAYFTFDNAAMTTVHRGYCQFYMETDVVELEYMFPGAIWEKSKNDIALYAPFVSQPGSVVTGSPRLTLEDMPFGMVAVNAKSFTKLLSRKVKSTAVRVAKVEVVEGLKKLAELPDFNLNEYL